MVDKDRVEGSAKQAAGKVKEFAAKSPATQAEAAGKADQVEANSERRWWLKDAVRGKYVTASGDAARAIARDCVSSLRSPT